MKFIHPQLFWLVPLVLAAVIGLGISATRRRREKLRLLLGRRAESPGALCLSTAKRRWRRFFLAAAACFLIAAAARPYWSTRRLPGRERGRDILVIFDVSRSMLATDLPPSRLDHAKFLLRELVKENRGDRFALVAFAGEAFLACPFTSDAAAFDQYVSELSPDMVPVGGTDLEKALRTALAAFRSAGGHRAVVIFTDGDELSGDSGRMIATLREQKIPIMVVGLGDPAAATPLPGEDGTLRRDREGKVITSRLNETALKRLAAENRGVYLRASVSDTGVAPVTARLQALDRAENDGGPKTVPVEKFPIALIGAAVSLAFALLISETPFRRRAALWAGMASALFLIGAAPVSEKLPPAPPAPAELPAAAEKQPPTDPDERYNQALSLQRKGETAKAVPLYEGLLRDGRAGSGTQSRALFNLGVANHGPARREFRAAEEELHRQQPDAALRKLAGAEAALGKAEELYMQSLAVPEAAAFEESITANLEALTLDRRAIEELKKKIEELKKQQQQARQQAKQAQQQNRNQDENREQDRQQQNRNQDENREQDRQQQNRPQDGNREQDRQQQNPNQDGRKSDAAREAARELERQARELGQRKLADDAAAAQRELEKAGEEQRRGDREKAQRHLDEAVKRLGDPGGGEERKPNSDSRKKQGGKPEKPRRGEGEAEGKPLPAQPEKEKSAGAETDDRRENAAEMVRILDDEAKELRDKLNRIRRSRRPAVEKDW